MRKVLSFVLVLSLVLGSFGMAFAAPLSDVAGEDFEDAVNVLTELGVIKGYPDGTYKPDNIVTRAEMAVIVVSALGLADYATGTSNFSDMAGHWSNPYVAYATSLGVISGYPDGTFRPDKTVSYDEAATMLVAALGYTPDSLQGTWPANFVVKAKSLGILDGIKAGAAGANRGDIAIMAYQTLDQAIGKTNKDGDWVANVPADTMLERLDAELYVPKAAEAWAATTDANDFIVLDSTNSVINLKPYLGALVTAYANSDQEVIAIKEVKSVALTGSYDASEQEFETVDGVVYDTSRVEGAAEIFFENGIKGDDKAMTTQGDFDGVVNVKISGKYLDTLYSFSVWTPLTTFQMTKDMVTELADDDTLNGYNFAMDDNDAIDTTEFELLGVDSLSDIAKDDVVTVYLKDNADATSDIARVEVGTEVVTGEVTKISSDKKKITVDGTAYEMWNEAAFTVKLGDEVELYLDYYGDVYEADVIDGGVDDYAVLLDVANGDTSLNGKPAVAKLFLADGTDKIFNVDDDITGVIEDGDWEVAYEKKGVLVEYTLDKDGVIEDLKIVDVETVVAETEITSKGYFDGKSIASDALIFTYEGETDSDLADEDAYGVTTLDKVKGNDYENVQYFQDPDSKKITLMLIPGEGTSDEEVYGLVTGWFETTASDTDYMGTFLVDGKEVEYELTSAGKTAVDGADNKELYLLVFNSSDQVRNVAKVTASGVTGGDAKLVKDGMIAVAYANGVVKIDKEYTVDSDAVAYEWDGDEYDKVTINRSNLSTNDYVALYDLDKDGVIDIILINANPGI
jgi:hypothetical protein